MKNAFPLPYNLFLFSKYFNFCLDFLVIQKNALIKTIRLISKFVTSQPGKETFAMHILPSISKSKGNQTMKFGQLINITWGTFFFKKHTQIVLEILFPGPFLQNQNLAYLWTNSLKLHTVCVYCMPSWGLSTYIETKLQSTCFYLIKLF